MGVSVGFALHHGTPVHTHIGCVGSEDEACEPTPTTPPPPPGTTPPPPQPCVWAEWGTWSICSATCGDGKQAQTRGIQTAAACGGTPCTGDVTKVQDCNVDVCPSCDAPVPTGESSGNLGWLQEAFNSAANEQERK